MLALGALLDVAVATASVTVAVMYRISSMSAREALVKLSIPDVRDAVCVVVLYLAWSYVVIVTECAM